MKNIYPKLFLIIILVVLAGTLKSQNLVHGFVTDKDSGLPIANVQVSENRNLQAAITDSLGKFTLEINEYPCILNFSHLSYELKNSLLQKPPRGVLRIVLSPNLYKIEEVFVIGSKIQHFFKEDLFSIKNYVISEGKIWILGYSNNNSLELEIRAIKLSGDLIARRKAKNGSKLFMDAFGNVHEVQNESINQLFIENDSISVRAFITDKEERDVFLNLVIHFDSLAIIKKVNPVGTYNEYYAYNYRDSSKVIFHKAYDHDLFDSSVMALKYKHPKIPDIIFPPFGQTMGWDPSDAFTRHSENRLLIYTKIYSQIFTYRDTIVIYQEKNPHFSLYSKDLKMLGSYNLSLAEGELLSKLNGEKIQGLQKDLGSGKIYLFTSVLDNLYVTHINPINGKRIKTIQENRLRFVNNVKVYNNRLYFLRQVPTGHKTIDLYSIPFD